MSCDQGCTTVGTILDRVCGLLNDRDPALGNVRWSRADLIGHLNEALCELSAHVPDAFAEVLDIVLKPGAQQKLADKFGGLISIEAHYANGEARPVSEANYRYAKIFKKKPCLARNACGGGTGDPCRDYRLKSYVKNPVDDTVFTVEPPVPPGCSITVKATVYGRPSRFCSADEKKCLGIGCEYEAQVVNWILYRAFSVDMESTQSRDNAKLYYELFNRGIELKNRAALRVEKEIDEAAGNRTGRQR